MSLKIPDPDNEDQEIEVFTAAELAEKETAITSAKDAELAEAKKEVERLNQHTALQKDNFKRLNEMTEAEKAALSAEKIEGMKRFEAAEARAAALEEKINNDTKTRVESDIESEMAKYHGGDEKLKEALKKNFDMINLSGTDTATIKERVKLAASMERGRADRINPLNTGFSGSAPHSVEKNKREEFLKSEKAKSAMKAMGEKVD